MQNNSNFEKIVRSRDNGKPDSRANAGKQWKREDKRKPFSHK